MASLVASAPNANAAFAAALFEELARAGVRHVCVCPGSRSAILALAAAEEPALACSVHTDERSAGFFALGLAKASRRPVALVCTSGTAAAGFHPAVIEACYAHVPLLVLTADRPPELREWGAGQTIDQVRIYGSATRWFAETPLPEPTRAALRHARALAARAVAEAVGAPAGPVHLNVPMRDPLAPLRDDSALASALRSTLDPGVRGRGGAPYTLARPPQRTPDPRDLTTLAERAAELEEGVVLCGPMDASPELAAAAARLARTLGWPLIAEPTSQLRRGPHVTDAPIIAHSDLLLREPSFAARCAAELVLRFGATPTSKALRLWLEAHPPRHVVHVDADDLWHDASHLASQIVRCDPLLLCDALIRRLGPLAPQREKSAYQQLWLDGDHAAADAIERVLSADAPLLESLAVRATTEALPDGALLYVSNSMPVRDLDAVLPVSPRRLRVLCNRGASGIDGMLSSALGAAAAGEGPVALLTGDLALLHDVGALATLRRLDLPLVIVVLDNGGGGIFSFLPVARAAPRETFETLFHTPHGVRFGPVAEGFGIRHQRVTSAGALSSALEQALARGGPCVIEVPIDRERNVAQHRALEAVVRVAVGTA
jgi:2-succinyl-5-enolpyruvyl-6-hydroxy-3-cyclohexene-1-carboxylate synthase